MTKTIEWNEKLKQKISYQEIFKIASDSQEPLIQDLVKQLVVMTKLLHPEETKAKVDHILLAFGFLKIGDVC